MLGGMSPSVRGIGNEVCFGGFSFAPNANANPVISGASSTLVGGLARWVESITYSATGIQTVVFREGFGFPGNLAFFVTAQMASLTEWFFATQIGAYNATTRTLVIQQHRAGAAREVPADAGARIHVGLVAQNTSAP